MRIKKYPLVKNFFLLLSIQYFCLLLSCSRRGYEKSIKRARVLLNTFCEITVISSDTHIGEKAIEEAFCAIEEVGHKYGYKPYSEVSRINENSGGKPVKISRELVEILETAINVSELTKGAFDVTVGALVDLWRFKKEEKRVPSTEEIGKVLPLVNYRNIILDSKNLTVSLKIKGMRLDLGGIAKGYAVEKAIAVLRKNGIAKAMVNLGGDLKVIGDRGSGRPWRIGLQHPQFPEKLITVLEYKDKAIATSGNYEQFFVKGGRRYHHILDPRIGYPADNGCVSVTIIADDATFADALATGVFVLGEEDGMKVIDSLNNVEGIIIAVTDGKMKISLSSGLKNKNLKFSY